MAKKKKIIRTLLQGNNGHCGKNDTEYKTPMYGLNVEASGTR